MSNLFTRLSVIVFVIVVMQFLSPAVFAQDNSIDIPFRKHLYLQPNAGFSQYFGDLNKKDFWNQHPKFGFGAAFGYQFTPVIGLRTQLVKTNVYSERTDQSKKLNADLFDGALNFTVSLTDWWGKYKANRLINLYFFSGAGITTYKSTLHDIATSALLEEHTKRQSEFFVPVGGGISVRLSSALSLNFEHADRTTFNGEKLDFIDAGKENNDHYSYTSAGVQYRFGAKDSDKDGVRDKEDLCIDTPGKIELAGCPDKDNDGIADKDDDCPDVAGLGEFKGCPDMDGDKIPDKDDVCPSIAGKAEFSGCPDTDNDGIADKDDTCPEIAGKIEFNGCPDRDGDGLADKDDLCPDIRGSVAFAGCPDTDGDGIPDNKDNCPDVAGIASTNGCPEALKGAFYEKIVYFDTDESIVLAKNIIDLNEVAALMNENPGAVLSIAGHADWRESDEYNMRLSERRADYVIKYIKKKGMKDATIDKSFFGKSRPIADNSTEEGMALNRRVEIKITK